jgi:glycosyltransferase involved in cell wall biosynthesis
LRILFVTDAWHPQINGVVRTLTTIGEELEKLGHAVDFVGPDQFRTLPLPTYGEIRMAVPLGHQLENRIERFEPEAIHIATEGTLGWSARQYCKRRGFRFTTSYHTRFPEYLAERAPVPLGLSYAMLRRFHAPSAALMVATQSIETELARRGFTNLRRWGRGVDVRMFSPRGKELASHPESADWPRPWQLYVGRIAVEKNLDAFIDSKVPGTKILVGAGPQENELQKRDPTAKFLGPMVGDQLAAVYSAADVFVFPSRTDTFGLVMLEALASGVPVAAFPVPGPFDILDGTGVGGLDENLDRAIEQALAIDPARCRAFAMNHSWTASAQQFLSNIHCCR